MKKCFVVLFALMLLLLSACGGGTVKEEAVVDIDAIATELAGADIFVDELSEQSKEAAAAVMALNLENVETLKVYLGSGAEAEEWGLFKCTTADAATELVSQLNDRIEAQMKTYEAYRAEAVPRIKNAILRRQGSYVMYIVADDYAEAQRIADNYFN